MENVNTKHIVYTIVVTYNGMQWIEKCLNSLIHSNLRNHNIIVVDNNSTDETVEFIRKNFPSVELILPGLNLGFGKANNLGLTIALENDCDYAFLLNQDAWIQSDTIEKMIQIQETQPEFGILSPIHLNADKSLDQNFSRFIFEDNKSPFFLDAFTKNSFSSVYPCKYINAASWLISRNCLLANGGFMPLFTHYGEDNNYCQRVLKSGLSIGFIPGVTIIHDRGERKRNYSMKNAYKRLYVEFLVIFAFPETKFSLYLKYTLKEFEYFLITNLNRPHKFIIAPLVLLRILINWMKLSEQRITSSKRSQNFL